MMIMRKKYLPSVLSGMVLLLLVSCMNKPVATSNENNCLCGTECYQKYDKSKKKYELFKEVHECRFL